MVVQLGRNISGQKSSLQRLDSANRNWRRRVCSAADGGCRGGIVIWAAGWMLSGAVSNSVKRSLYSLRHFYAGDPDQYISTSYVERQNLSLRMGQRRFTRLTNGFSKKLDNHVAAVALYVAHYNLCRVHEALKTTPAKALGVVDRVWAIGDMIDAALATQPIMPVPTAPERRKGFRVI